MTRRIFRFAVNWVLIVPLVTLVPAGCREPSGNVSPSGGSRAGQTDQTSQEIASPESRVFREDWDALFAADTKIGHTHTSYRKIREDGRDLIEITSETELKMNRYGQTIVQELSLKSVETPEGQLVRFETRLDATAAHGERQGDLLKLTTISPGRTETTTIPCPDTTAGFFATEQSLAAAPMKPGGLILVEKSEECRKFRRHGLS